MYETSKENESKLTAMLESYRQQILELESKAGSYETVVGRSEFTVSELQRQIRDSNDKILELESRIRYITELSISCTISFVVNINLKKSCQKNIQY